MCLSWALVIEAIRHNIDDPWDDSKGGRAILIFMVVIYGSHFVRLYDLTSLLDRRQQLFRPVGSNC